MRIGGAIPVRGSDKNSRVRVSQGVAAMTAGSVVVDRFASGVRRLRRGCRRQSARAKQCDWMTRIDKMQSRLKLKCKTCPTRPAKTGAHTNRGIFG